MGRLDGKVAIVTGGSRGVGKAVCLALAREGADVVIGAKTAEPHAKLPGTIHDTAKELEALGRKALPLQVDVRDEAQIDSMVAKAVDRFGKVDILVNNAGAIFIADAVDTPAKRFDLMMGINARAAFLCARAVIPYMKGGGHIVMMSPPIHPEKLGGKVAYGMSKLGMTLCAMGLAEELRDLKISCNALWPVTMVESSAVKNFQMGSEDMWRKPEILADATLELVCSRPGEITGQALYDEDVLRKAGVTDFDARYAVIPGTHPPPLSKALFE